MRAGDVDGDGQVQDVDILLFETQSNAMGYVRSDVNLDGIVDGADLTNITQRLGTTSTVTNPAVNLRPSLRITPPRRTLIAGTPLTLRASEFTGVVTWAFLENNSGGLIDPSQGSSITYTAGNTSDVVDVIQAWDTSNRLAQAFLNVISEATAAKQGKAVIVAGGLSEQDLIWPATDYLADKAFRSFGDRGFSEENIQYLSLGPEKDVAAAGNETNDIDVPHATSNEMEAVFTGLSGAGTDRLTVYMVDHGADAEGAGQFRLNGTELIPAVTVNTWLNDLQDQYTNLHVTVILDFCYAGSYLDELVYTNGPLRRIVISSTASNELTYFLADGRISFSEYFFNGVLQGRSLMGSYELARDAMGSFQSAWIDDTQDGVYEPEVDGVFALTNYIGASFIAGKDFPIIGSVLGNQSLSGQTSVRLWAKNIASPSYDLERVWCTILPPGYAANPTSGVPVVEVTTRDLTENPLTGGLYETEFEGFTEQGQYTISYYAEDIWGSVSPPVQRFVVQDGFLEKVVLVAGGDASDTNSWPGVLSTARLAYQTLQSRLIASSNIYVLSSSSPADLDGDGTNDVIDTASFMSVRQAIQTWGDDADRLTVYLIGGGGGENGAYQVSPTDSISAAELDGWLDGFQSMDRTVNVILEFPGSGGFVPNLQPPSDRDRYTVASSAADRKQVLEEGTSFSTFLLSGVSKGESLGIASGRSRKAIRRASGNLRQKALIDDNNNGVPNEKNSDGTNSLSRFIGSPFFTGEDIPHIAEVTPETTLTNATLLLYATGVSDADGISDVWVEITPPKNFAGSVTDRFDLTNNVAQAQWDGMFNGFSDPGVYALTFYAQDSLSNVSAGVQSRVIKIDTNRYAITPGALPDAFEPDNTSSNAFYSDLPLIQAHTLHVSNDCDWVKFYAVDDQIYDIETVHLDTNSTIDTVLEVYREEEDGSLTLLDTVDEFGRDEGELTGLDFPTNGFYYVRVCQAPDSEFAPGAYLLVVYVPAGFNGVNVRVVDVLGRAVLPGATVRLKKAGGGLLDFQVSDANGYVRFTGAAPDGYRVEVVPPGAEGEYRRLFNPFNPIRGPDDPTSYYGNERLVGPEDFGVISYNKVILAQGTYLAFGFIPVAYLSGTVKNELTGEPVAAAALAILRNSDGFKFSRYPWAFYADPWLTDIDGLFPHNTVIVPPNTVVTPLAARNGFHSYTHPFSIVTPSRGQTWDVGQLVLSPTYGGNAIPDFWELSHGLPTNVNVNLDPDGDLQTHLEEWIAGTNPNDGGSFFQAQEVTPNVAGMATLRWVGAPSRRYSIWRNDDLTDPSGWTLVYGPLQNGPAYGWMEWSDPQSFSLETGHYLIEVSAP
jgi:hypothetical protein